MTTTVIVLILVSYFLGAIPTGYLIAKKVMGIDIREHGSGNPGAANVYRTVGKWAGVSTFLVDALKGFIPVSAALYLCADYPHKYWVAIACGTIAILGHMWTIYLKFRGGKGVATSAGVFAALLPIPTAIAFGVFVICVALWGRISIGSICACIGSIRFSRSRTLWYRYSSPKNSRTKNSEASFLNSPISSSYIFFLFGNSIIS